MTKEQEKAIEWLKNKPQEYTNLINSCSYIGNKKAYAKDRTMFKTVLNLIQQQQEESEKYKYLYNRALSELVIADKKNIEKDKIIDLMAWTMTHEDIPQDAYCIIRTMGCEQVGGSTYECKECIKQYFEKKVSKE